MNKNTIIDMKTSQFPFGEVQDQVKDSKKVLIKKRICYKSDKQHSVLQQKINILKNIYHKNIINFRYLEDDQDGYIDIYYNYVPFAFETFFQQCDSSTIREIHKQLIQLVIHLAKHSILTSFNPSRCGVMLNADNKWQIKYYLPLNELVITNNISMLERSVQIFTVQSLHYLDLLAQSNDDQNSAILCHSKYFQQRFRDSTSFDKQNRRQSQLYLRSLDKHRRLSNQGALYQFSRRKFSNFSIRKSQFSQDSNCRGNASTLFQTIRSSNPTIDDMKINNESLISIMKPQSPSNILQRAKSTKQRSMKALQRFSLIIRSMQMARDVQALLLKRNK